MSLLAERAGCDRHQRGYSLQERLTDVWKTPENQQLNQSSSDNGNIELYSCAAAHLIVRLTQVKHREAASVMNRREERV